MSFDDRSTESFHPLLLLIIDFYHYPPENYNALQDFLSRRLVSFQVARNVWLIATSWSPHALVEEVRHRADFLDEIVVLTNAYEVGAQGEVRDALLSWLERHKS